MYQGRNVQRRTTGRNRIKDEPHDTELNPEWPLYTPKMKPLDLSFAEDVPELVEALSWLNSKKKYDDLLRGLPRKQRRTFQNSQMAGFKVQLLDSGIIEKAERKDILSWCKMFALAEPTKRRYRLIIEPRDLNDRWKSEGFPYPSLPQIDDVKALVMASEIITIADLKCYYYQLPLSEEVRNHFGIQLGNEVFRLTRLPIGACISVFVANTISRYMQEMLLPGPHGHSLTSTTGTQKETTAKLSRQRMQY
jgi:hypothetical protein